MHAENVLPIPASPGYARTPSNRKTLRDSRQSATVPAATAAAAATAASVGGSDPVSAAAPTAYQVDRDYRRSEGPPQEEGGESGGNGNSSGGRGSESSSPTSPQGEQSGTDVDENRNRARTALSPSPQLPPARTTDAGAVLAGAVGNARQQQRQHRPHVRPVLGSRSGVHVVGGGSRAGEGIWEGGEEGQSDTDILTDPESGSDSDSDAGETDSEQGKQSVGTEFGGYETGQTVPGASDAPTAVTAVTGAVAAVTGDVTAATGDVTAVTSAVTAVTGDVTTVTGAVTSDVTSAVTAVTTAVIATDDDGSGNEKTDGIITLASSPTERNINDEEAGARRGFSSPQSSFSSGSGGALLPRNLCRTPSPSSMVLLRGGGGGSSSGGSMEGDGKGDTEDDACGEGWSMVGSDDGMEAMRWGGKGQERGIDDQERGTDEEKQARSIQLEFVNGYLDEVGGNCRYNDFWRCVVEKRWGNCSRRLPGM